jgi:hypothetical protein
LVLVPRKLRVALFALVVLVVAVAAGTARAVPRMPIGFYDDPSFRWAPKPTVNLASAEKAHASIIHVLADWSQIAPTKPKSALNGNDPAYKLSDLDDLLSSAAKYDLQVLVTISGTPRWANGNQTPNHPPKNLNNLTQFAHMLAARYNGTHPGFGVVTRFSVWNEPNLEQFLTPQFSGTKAVSPATYAKLFLAVYNGIKAGNKQALVAAGETSNRGHNVPTPGSDSLAPATFARLVSVANPKLPFDAWATHPYPSVYALGPAQKVAYPNVSLSTMGKFGVSLEQWFHRRVPIWVTEYGEQTKPEYPTGGVSYALQAAHAKLALQEVAADPAVEMFIWFIFRDSTSKTWFSGLEKRSGAKKPAYATFAKQAAQVVGQTQFVQPGKTFPVTLAVPYLTFYDAPGAVVGVTYRVYDGKKVVAVGQPRATISANQSITFTVKFAPAKGKSYTMTALVNDKHGQTAQSTVALLPPPGTETTTTGTTTTSKTTTTTTTTTKKK